MLTVRPHLTKSPGLFPDRGFACKFFLLLFPGIVALVKIGQYLIGVVSNRFYFFG